VSRPPTTEPFDTSQAEVLIGQACRRVPGDGPLLVRTAFEVGWPPGPPRLDGTDFDLVTDDGARVHIVVDDAAVLQPHHVVNGTWLELHAHPAVPDAALAGDARIGFRGFWLAEGDRVAVAGKTVARGFVDGTGGPRQAPQALHRFRADAIGTGDDPGAALARAAAQRWPTPTRATRSVVDHILDLLAGDG